ncbi:MAG: protein kinase [Candidatus Latescibacteria bacterium]|nr:protein kinase [Candidatus Latescibacterota bacterium]
MVGQNLSHYHILEQYTQGGMEEVYLAEDIREHRKVVLKVLPPALRRDGDRMQRIKADVEAASRLHHKNIARTYAIEQAENQAGISQHFVTVEQVSGQMLSRIIPAEGLPVTRILGWFTQLANALDESHKRRITHRDLKPENILITEDDVPKIIDFGLARIIRPDLDVRDSQSHTRSVDVLRTLMHSGALLDGIAYMSPEQAEGRDPDHRTDIFSYGAILYQVVTGRRPFSGESYVDLVSSIMRDEPEAITVLKPGAPYLLNQTIITCLQKDVRRRYQSMQKVGEELEEIRRKVEPRKVMEEKLAAKTRPVPLEDDAKSKDASFSDDRSSHKSGRPILPGVMLVIGVLLTWVVLTQMRKPPTETVRKLPIDLTGVSEGSRHIREDVTVAPIISPNGARILYSADERLWVRDSEKTVSIEVPESYHAAVPFWSPGSDRIGYFTENDTVGIWSMHTIIPGEPDEISLAELQDTSIPTAAAWRSDGSIIFSVTDQDGEGGILYAVPDSGGTPYEFLTPDPSRGEIALSDPAVLANGESLLYAAETRENARVMLLTQSTRETLIERPGEMLSRPMYSQRGYLLYQRNLGASNAIWAIAFDGKTTSGSAFLVTEYGENLTVSETDVLLYHANMPSQHEQLIWIDRHGHISGYIGQPQDRIDNPTISPDGHRIAVTGTERGNTDIWVHEGYLGEKSRVTRDAAYDYFPVWSPSGSQLAFSSVRNVSSDIFLVSTDGKGRVLPVVTGRKSEWVASWSRDGRYLAYEVDDPDTKRDLWYIPMDGDRSPRPFLRSDAQEFYPNLAPDGEYVAYQSDETGRSEIYVSQFPSGRSRIQISQHGGTAPRWAGSGNELFFIEGTVLMAVTIDRSRGGVRQGTTETLFSAEDMGVRMLGEYLEPAYDVAPDGQRFVMVQRRRTSTIMMVENWYMEFQGQ